MTDRIFIDTNILVYSFLENDINKHDAAAKLLSEMTEKEVFISIQVMNEIYAALSKNGIEHEMIAKYLFELEEIMNVCSIDFHTIKKCLFLKQMYGYSYWDSLILSSSLESGCRVVYSEDMQHRQVIDNMLMIVNPFFK